MQLQKHSASYSAAVSIIKHLDFVYRESKDNYSFGIFIEKILGHEEIFVSVPVEKKDGRLVMIDQFWKDYSEEKTDELVESLKELSFEKKLALHLLESNDEEEGIN